jgi:hypothetical protein
MMIAAATSIAPPPLARPTLPLIQQLQGRKHGRRIPGYPPRSSAAGVDVRNAEAHRGYWGQAGAHIAEETPMCMHHD